MRKRLKKKLTKSLGRWVSFGSDYRFRITALGSYRYARRRRKNRKTDSKGVWNLGSVERVELSAGYGHAPIPFGPIDKIAPCLTCGRQLCHEGQLFCHECEAAVVTP